MTRSRVMTNLLGAVTALGVTVVLEIVVNLAQLPPHHLVTQARNAAALILMAHGMGMMGAIVIVVCEEWRLLEMEEIEEARSTLVRRFRETEEWKNRWPP